MASDGHSHRPPPDLAPDQLLAAYRMGIFPMAVPEYGNAIFWFAPDPRGILPLDGFHVSKSLRRTVRQQRFEVRFDADFEAVVRACAAPRDGHGESWISEAIVRAYCRLHQLGHAPSVACYREGALAGGLYGVAFGAAFCGESMFHHARDASKVALVHLVRTLRRWGFQLLDTQYTTPHLERFGAQAIPRHEYEARLADAVTVADRWGGSEG